MAQLTRRNFVHVAAAAAGTAAPADDADAEPEAAPAADGEGVEALYETKESRGGQIIYTKVIPGEWSAE